MEGVILFADDNIFDNGFENKLFKEFLKDGDYTVLPINNLSVLENSISSISTFRALIIDWNFKRGAIDEEDNFAQGNDENPLEFLRNTKLFSIVYVYSQENIDQAIKDELQSLYPNRIHFEKKNVLEESKNEFEKVKKGILDFEMKNSHLKVPYVWSQAINESAQQIFSELEQADKFWIKELYYSSVRNKDKNGVPTVVELEPTVEVINLFQNILSERLVQNTRLKSSIDEYSQSNFKEEANFDDILKLYSKLYYTPTFETDTIMTGDIYKIGEDCYGIIISPECDIMRLIGKNEYVECLCFSIDSFNQIKNFIKTNKRMDEKEKAQQISRAYNQENSAIHLLPIYEFDDQNVSTALIDFRFNLKLVKGKYLDDNRKNRKKKLNTPYIQQLRQRYLSYIGRVGVPAIPELLRLSPK